jgi:hypothetical protein
MREDGEGVRTNNLFGMGFGGIRKHWYILIIILLIWL